MQNKKYFKGLRDDLDDGGYKNLLHYLLTYDISEFDVRTPPVTDALKAQKILSLEPQAQWWYGRLVDGFLAPGHTQWHEPVAIETLHNHYLVELHRLGIQRKNSKSVWGRFFAKVIKEWGSERRVQRPKYWMDYDLDGQEQRRKSMAWCYHFPPLERCRADWEDLYGSMDWPKPIEAPPLDETEEAPV
jgi:hypothetical protein